MSDKIVSHQRFLRKMERDLNDAFRRGEHESFIRKFRMYAEQGEPEIGLMEKFYESLSHMGNHDAVMEYALLQMNEGRGHYDVHMSHLLKALLAEERYYEVIEFSDHIMEEDIPQKFRIEVAALRHEAKKGIDARAERYRDPEPEVAERIVSPEDYRGMEPFEKLEFLRGLVEQEDARYRSLVRGELPDEEKYVCVTFMLLYLKAIDDDEAVAVRKMDERMDVVPSGLPALDETLIYGEVRRLVMDAVEDRMPEFREAADQMLMSHAVHCYPVFPSFEPEMLAHGYLDELFSMLNLDYEHEVDEAVVRWIRSVEESMASR